MNPSRSFATMLLLLVACFTLPSVSAKATPQFYETTVIEDTPDDYAAQSGYDIVAVYASEKFLYDSEKQTPLGEQLALRIELGSPQSIPCASAAGYEVSFKMGGQARTVNARTLAAGPADTSNACGVKPAGGSGIVTFVGNSVVLTLSSATLGLTSGMVLSDFTARSFLAAGSTDGSGGTPVYQDFAPYDNKNAPDQGSSPDAPLKSYTSIGVYPFIRVEPVTPLEQYSVGGSEIKYSFNFISDPGLKDDNVRVRFTIPTDWTVAPSQGKTGANPEGQLGTSGGVPREFFFTLSSTGLVSEGDMAHVMMDVYTDSGGHVQVMTMTTVTGAKIEDPNLSLSLTSAGPFKASKESAITFTASVANGTLDGAKFSIDVMQGTRRIGTTTATNVGPGLYAANFTFPGDGVYVLDVYQSNLKPSPHQEFTVNVQKGGLAPGPGPFAILVLLGMAAFLRRARP